MHEPIELTLGTKMFKLVLSAPAICDFEDAMTPLLPPGSKRYNFGDFILGLGRPVSFTEVANLIRATAWRQSGKKQGLTVDYVKEALDAPEGYTTAMTAVGEMLKAAYPAKEGEEAAPAAAGKALPPLVAS